MDESDAFSPEVLELLLQSNLRVRGAWGCRPVCAGMRWRYCGRVYEGVETAHGGTQYQSKAVWAWGGGRGGACSVTRPNTP